MQIKKKIYWSWKQNISVSTWVREKKESEEEDRAKIIPFKKKKERKMTEQKDISKVKEVKQKKF